MTPTPRDGRRGRAEGEIGKVDHDDGGRAVAPRASRGAGDSAISAGTPATASVPPTGASPGASTMGARLPRPSRGAHAVQPRSRRLRPERGARVAPVQIARGFAATSMIARRAQAPSVTRVTSAIRPRRPARGRLAVEPRTQPAANATTLAPPSAAASIVFGPMVGTSKTEIVIGGHRLPTTAPRPPSAVPRRTRRWCLVASSGADAPRHTHRLPMLSSPPRGQRQGRRRTSAHSARTACALRARAPPAARSPRNGR